MKKTTVWKCLALSLLLAGSFLGFQPTIVAQPCWLTFPPGGSAAATVNISGPWALTGDYTPQANPSYFIDQVTVGNAEVSAGTYLGWCIDVVDNIDPDPITYSTLMFSSCDTNLDAELSAVGYSYPGTVYVTPAVWNQVNYILNNNNGAYFYDVQVAIWTLVGGPVPDFVTEPPFPPTDTNVVNALLTAASNNAASWQPQCGDVIAVIVVESSSNESNPIQLSMIEVPYPCVPCISVTKQVACLQPTNDCAEFSKFAEGYVGVGCAGSGGDEPAFCYQISVTNCGTIPLTNIVVSDSLLGLLSANFFTNASQVLQPGAGATVVVSMSVGTTTTNTVTVTADTALTNTVTNANQVVVTNGTPVSATDYAVAGVDTAAVTCSLTLYSPLDLDGNLNDNDIILPVASFYSIPPTVTLSIHVCNSGVANLTDVTINIPALSAFNCSAPPPFNLAPGACQDFQLCLGSVTCPANMNFNLTVTGQVVPDNNHCGVFDLSSTNVIGVCSSCSGSISCSTNTGCLAGTGDLSGTVLLHCTVGSTNTSGDSGLSGIPVILLGGSNNPLTTNITDINGNYSFSNLASGAYCVLVTAPTNYVETYPVGNNTSKQVVKITVCANVTNVDFGYANTQPPTLSVAPGSALGCNPANLPTDSSVSSQVIATGSCGMASNMVTHVDTTNGCTVTRTFTVVVSDTYGNSATTNAIYTWTADSTPPVFSGVPMGKYLGCNPTNVPTVAGVQAAVSASDTCSPATVHVTGFTTTNGCAITQVFTIIATNACGNKATACVTNTWVADSTPPVFSGVPMGKYLGCNPTNVPTAASVQAMVSASDTCSPATVLVTGGVPSTNGCAVTQIFTIIATNACGNMAMASVTNTWTALGTILVTNTTLVTNITLSTNNTFVTNHTLVTNITVTTNITVSTNCCTNAICGNFNSQNPGSGWLWLNAHVSGTPGSNCVLSCENASVTLSCTDGKTYSFPIPNGQITFSSSCTVATNWFDGTQWYTTLPCAGDSQIFLQGCAIPWQVDFANCKSVCWSAVFCSSAPAFNCNWQWGAACYSDSLPACGSIAPKACLQTPCPNGQYYNSSDSAGCPENHKPYCVAGGTGGGGANCTGSWSGTSTTCTFGITTNITYTPVTTVTTNTTVTPVTTIITNTTVTPVTTVTPTMVVPVLYGVPTGTNFGCNPASVPTAASIEAVVTASETCSLPTVLVTEADTTNGCAVKQVFTITATDNCGNMVSAYVTNTWTADKIPPVIHGVPANSYLGCGVTNLPGDTNVFSEVSATDQCGSASITVSHVDSTNGCSLTRTFTITATDACGNMTTTNLIYTWTGRIPETCTNSICAGFNSHNPGSGWLWLNAHVSGNPGQNATLYCQNATVTLNCSNGKNYTYPVPNGIINFSSTCTAATNWFDGTSWNTTLPCAGDDQVFLQGCTIPWQSAFANCQSVCWTGVFSCTTPGLSFNWQWGAACYANDQQPAYSAICPKACHQTPCPNGQYYSASDNAGTPENHKPYCVAGGTGLGGANCTGSWSGIDTTCTFTAGTSLPPVLNGVPANDNLGINPTNIPTVASVQAVVTATDTCSPAPVYVTVATSTNACAVTQIFTITATNSCGNYATAYVTNTWTTLMLTNHCTNTICTSFNGQNPGSGWVWFNSQLSGKPGSQEVLIVCSNTTVTLNCTDGKSYTFPIPNGQILFTPTCTAGTNWFDGTNWNTTLPCGGDDQIFLQGCAIPWQSDFANCKSVCWTGDYSCNVPGLSFNCQFGAACYNDSQPTHAAVCPKACHQTPCQNGQYFNQNDNAGCPENHSPYCVGGGTGYGGSNCTGNFSNPGTCNF